jgi:hypothetical protein
MSTEDEAEQAISLLNGALLGDRLITVKEVTKQNAGKPGSSCGDQRNQKNPQPGSRSKRKNF